MDLREFEVNIHTGKFTVIAQDVIVVDGFVMFINVDEEDDTTKTVAMFNGNTLYSVMEVTK